MPDKQAEHTLRTREAYDRLAAVWSSTTDEGPFNGFLERPALRALVPGDLHGATVLDAGCGRSPQPSGPAAGPSSPSITHSGRASLSSVVVTSIPSWYPKPGTKPTSR